MGLWEASSFSPKYITMKISMTDIRDSFGVRVELTECKSFTYILSAVTDTGRAVDSQGELSIGCPEDVFDDQNDIQDIGDDNEDGDNNTEDDIAKDRSFAARSLTAKETEKSIKVDSVQNSAHIKANWSSSFHLCSGLLLSFIALHQYL